MPATEVSGMDGSEVRLRGYVLQRRYLGYGPAKCFRSEIGFDHNDLKYLG